MPPQQEEADNNSAASKQLQDEKDSLHSRSGILYGNAGLQKLDEAKIFFLGMRGSSTDAAKNVLLGGAGYVACYDNATADLFDLSDNCFMLESAVSAGLTRADAVVENLKRLSPFGTVRAVHLGPDQTLENHIADTKYDFVQISDQTKETTESISCLCRSLGIKYSVLNTLGVAGQLFLDLGATHIVADANAKSVDPCVIDSIAIKDPDESPSTAASTSVLVTVRPLLHAALPSSASPPKADTPPPPPAQTTIVEVSRIRFGLDDLVTFKGEGCFIDLYSQLKCAAVVTDVCSEGQWATVRIDTASPEAAKSLQECIGSLLPIAGAAMMVLRKKTVEMSFIPYIASEELARSSIEYARGNVFGAKMQDDDGIKTRISHWLFRYFLFVLFN